MNPTIQQISFTLYFCSASRLAAFRSRISLMKLLGVVPQMSFIFSKSMERLKW